jgi:hypothetical protein
MWFGCGFTAPGGQPSNQFGIPDANGPVVDAGLGDGATDATLVGSDAPIDPPPSVTCPTGYNHQLGYGGTVRKYRLLTSGKSFWEHHSNCLDDQIGSTHLAVINSTTELAELIKHVKAQATQPANARYYVGLVQASPMNQPNQGWIGLDGKSPPSGIWESAPGNEQPNDGVDNDELNHEEQLAWIDVDDSTGVVDAPGPTTYGAICECDGVAVDATATQYINDDPNNPN